LAPGHSAFGGLWFGMQKKIGLKPEFDKAASAVVYSSSLWCP